MISFDIFRKLFYYKFMSSNNDNWKSINNTQNTTYDWNDASTYIKHPPYFDTQNKFELNDIKNARNFKDVIKYNEIDGKTMYEILEYLKSNH